MSGGSGRVEVSLAVLTAPSRGGHIQCGAGGRGCTAPRRGTVDHRVLSLTSARVAARRIRHSQMRTVFLGLLA